ncbi:MAG TPA: KpsF/GutQ family sugar-phosphate isomerase [Candidatus Aminicenantes bacterium]|nr:KpsF/GutQ family sugar-phosphate isomerase [Candidatus Aminicenantes bacterium]
MNKQQIIDIGRDVLTIEANAVTEVGRSLDDNFAAAVDLLAKTRMRVIILGMGKSGLVGRKVAATMTSCGTPATFVHPAEAGHGDLGMIRKNDVVIAISYSGETREIVDLLEFIKRIGVKLISITGFKHSRIARYSDIVIEAKVEREAGPVNFIPTASSTAALALGDAIAIAVMRKKGLSEKAFASVHPKGQAGRNLLKVEALMRRSRRIPSVKITAPMTEVIEEMSEKKLGMTCVVDEENRLVGIITDGDLRRLIERSGADFLSRNAEQVMTPEPVTIDKRCLATEALNLMEDKKITSLIIKNSNRRVEGIVHLHDLWRTEMF